MGKINQRNYLNTLGDVLWLAQQSEIHADHYSAGYLFHRISEGILHNQYKLIHNEQNIPLAFAVWAQVDESTLGQLLTTTRPPKKTQWNNGGNIFFTEFICPFKHVFQFSRELKNTLPDRVKIYAKRTKIQLDVDNKKINPYSRTMSFINKRH